MNCEVEIANLWINANMLTINAEKSSALVINPGAKTVTQKPKIVWVSHMIAVNTVVPLNTWDYGLTKTLNLTSQLKFVERKIAWTVGIINCLNFRYKQ